MIAITSFIISSELCIIPRHLRWTWPFFRAHSAAIWVYRCCVFFARSRGREFLFFGGTGLLSRSSITRGGSAWRPGGIIVCCCCDSSLAPLLRDTASFSEWQMSYMQLKDLGFDILLQQLSIKHHFRHFRHHPTSIATIRIRNLRRIGFIGCENAAAGEDIDPFAYSFKPTVEDVFGVACLLGNECRFIAVFHRNKIIIRGPKVKVLSTVI